MPHHSFAVSTGRDAPSAVRDALRARAAHFSPQMRDDLLLLLTEVVTNAVRHSGATTGDPIRIALNENRDCVRVEVTDPGDGFAKPDRLRPDPTKNGGGGARRGGGRVRA